MLICLLINIGMPIFDSPKSVHVELTDKCNAECPVCVRRLGGGKLNSIIQNVELGVDYFENLLGEEFCSNVQHWQFCGTKGDPVACSELYEIIVYLKNCNPDCIFSIHTNGGFRSEKWWTKLGRLLRGTPSFVVWGIDGLEDTNHIHRRNVKWNKLWANLNAFNNTGAHSLWQFLVFEHNRHQMSEIKDICKKLNIRFESKDAFGFGIQEKDGIKEVYPIEVFDKDGNFDYTINPHFSNQENVKIFNDGYGLVKEVQAYSFNFIEGNPLNHRTDIESLGFMAHEIQEAAGKIRGSQEIEPVIGEKDAIDGNQGEPVYQMVDYSKLTVIIWDALRDVISKVEKLETRVKTLEDAANK